jgi:biopolymer transport protein ExbD
MRTYFILALALAACNKKDAADNAAPPAAAPPAAAPPAAAPPAAPAAPAPAEPAPAAKPVAPAAAPVAMKPPECAPAVMHVDHDGYALKRNKEVKAKKDGLEHALKELGTECIGPLSIVAGDDVPYQDIVTAMDVAQKVGFTEVSLGETAAGHHHARPAHDDFDIKSEKGPDGKMTITGTARHEDPKTKYAHTPVIVVTQKEITVGATHIPVGDKELAKQVAAALAAMPKGEPAGTVILQADSRLPGKVINDVIRGANDSGYGDVLFAVKSK